jgi:hypothetical protein
MRGSTLPALRICWRCCNRSLQQPNFSTSVNTSPKPLPLRIFSTEDVEEDYYSRKDGVRGDSSKAERQERYKEWIGKRVSLVPSDERLSEEFRARSGGHQPRGLLDVAKRLITDRPTRTQMLSRMRTVKGSVSRNAINPVDLLRPPEPSHTDDTILTDIGTCISAAIDRLQLYKPNEISSPTGRILIPHDQYLWLCHILQFQFAKHQLIMYGYRHSLVKSHLQRQNTTDVIRKILETVWNLEKEPPLPPDEALVTKSMHQTNANTKFRHPNYTARKIFYDRRRYLGLGSSH